MNQSQLRRILYELFAPPKSAEVYLQIAMLAFAIFLSSLLGILTRPVGFLAAFWPANAVLLGLIVRYPALHTLWSWIAAFLAYLTADLITNGSLTITLWLTAANLMAAFTGVFLFGFVTPEDRRLNRPVSVLYLFFICLTTGIASGVTGAGVATVLFDRSWSDGFAMWFSTELVNAILIVPVILTAPHREQIWLKIVQFAHDFQQIPSRLLQFGSKLPQTILHNTWETHLANVFHLFAPIAPIIALIGTAAVSVVVGGAGAIMFPVPALLWCALTYSTFQTSLLTFLFCSWKMIAVAADILVIHPASTDYLSETMSLRLGISLLALGPLTIASIHSTQKKLMQSLNRAVKHDYLTDTLARGAFIKQALSIIEHCSSRQIPFAVLMLDIDHFKKVNDHHGHLAGDQALISFTKTLHNSLRKTDCFGRLGGEEFSIIMPHVTLEQARAVAERLRQETEQSLVQLPSGDRLHITVSIGMTHPDISEEIPPLDTLLTIADRALYLAKSKGRNRVEYIDYDPSLPVSEDTADSAWRHTLATEMS